MAGEHDVTTKANKIGKSLRGITDGGKRVVRLLHFYTVSHDLFKDYLYRISFTRRLIKEGRNHQGEKISVSHGVIVAQIVILSKETFLGLNRENVS